MLLLFVVAPPAAWWFFDTVPIFPVLWAYAAVAVLLLWRDPGFALRELWSRGDATWSDVRFVLLRFLVLAAGIAALFGVLRWQEWWAATPFVPAPWAPLPRLRPGFWAVLIVLYPLVSVVPQNLVWRAWFVRRYAGVFGEKDALGGVGIALASAACFGWAHVVLGNAFAVLATLVGGWLFVRTYQRTRCLALATFEHALYGCWMFTIGFGWAFFPATPELLERIGEQMRAAGLGP